VVAESINGRKTICSLDSYNKFATCHTCANPSNDKWVRAHKVHQELLLVHFISVLVCHKVFGKYLSEFRATVIAYILY
jgi:hypothetical protein